jgi:excisionase family DNA binding protein
MCDRQQLALVPEFSVAETANVLGVDRRTVKDLIKSGILRVRVAGVPSSRRPRYRIPQSDVLAFRNGYQTVDREARSPAKTTKRNSTDQLKHIHLE